MGKFWATTKREYLERVRTKWFIIATVFGPVLFGAITFLPSLMAMHTKASADVARIVVLDATGTNLGQRVANALGTPQAGSADGAIVRVVTPDGLTAAESLATHEVMQNQKVGYLALDFQTVAGEKARYAGRNASSLSDMDRMESAVRKSVLALRLEQAGVDSAHVEALIGPKLSLESERITDAGRGGSGMVSVIFGFGIAFLLYMSILLYGQNVLRGVIEEKSSRMSEVIASSVPTDILLAGKVLGVGAVGLTQLVVWVGTGIAFLKLRVPILTAIGAHATTLPLPSVSIGLGLMLLAFFVLGYVFYASLFAAVGATVSNEQDVQQAAMPVILLLVVSILFISPILADPSSRLAVILSWLPFSSPIIMPLRLSVISLPPLVIAGSMVVLVLGCAVAVWLAARIYRVGLLMYGKRPNLRELVRWVRYAG
jgi:ABC-2 type transport system permease protein